MIIIILLINACNVINYLNDKIIYFFMIRKIMFLVIFISAENPIYHGI